MLAEQPKAMTATIRGTEGGIGPQTMEIGRKIIFDINADQNGELALIHLSADHVLSFIYPSPKGDLPLLEPNVATSVGDDLRLEVSEPAGTEYWLVLNTSDGMTIPESVPLIAVENWAQAYLITNDPIYSASLISWLGNRSLLGWALIEVNVVNLGDAE